jgi:hypothetical protein
MRILSLRVPTHIELAESDERSSKTKSLPSPCHRCPPLVPQAGTSEQGSNPPRRLSRFLLVGVSFPQQPLMLCQIGSATPIFFSSVLLSYLCVTSCFRLACCQRMMRQQTWTHGTPLEPFDSSASSSSRSSSSSSSSDSCCVGERNKPSQAGSNPCKRSNMRNMVEFKREYRSGNEVIVLLIRFIRKIHASPTEHHLGEGKCSQILITETLRKQEIVQT